MSDTLAGTKFFTVTEFLAEENLGRIDEALTEVFAIMLGVEARADCGIGNLSSSKIMVDGAGKRAVVGFTGVARGSCEICMSDCVILAIANAMLGGVPAEEFDDSMCDAAGELCNMITGGWKNRVPSLQSCSLTPPRVSAASYAPVSASAAVAAIHRGYIFQGHRLQLTLLVETISTQPGIQE